MKKGLVTKHLSRLVGQFPLCEDKPRCCGHSSPIALMRREHEQIGVSPKEKASPRGPSLRAPAEASRLRFEPRSAGVLRGRCSFHRLPSPKPAVLSITLRAHGGMRATGYKKLSLQRLRRKVACAAEDASERMPACQQSALLRALSWMPGRRFSAEHLSSQPF